MPATHPILEEELLANLRKAACAYIYAHAANHGPVSAEITDNEGFHELTVCRDGSLLFAAYAGDRVPVDADFENLPWATLSALVAECQA